MLTPVALTLSQYTLFFHTDVFLHQGAEKGKADESEDQKLMQAGSCWFVLSITVTSRMPQGWRGTEHSCEQRALAPCLPPRFVMVKSGRLLDKQPTNGALHPMLRGSHLLGMGWRGVLSHLGHHAGDEAWQVWPWMCSRSCSTPSLHIKKYAISDKNMCLLLSPGALAGPCPPVKLVWPFLCLHTSLGLIY